MRRKKAEAPDATATGGRITPRDVQEVEFRLAFRGYNERDVDAFLDRVTEDLGAYLEELERLRAGAPAGPAAGDVEAARSEAERILAEARREADRILAEAQARAASIGLGGADPRGAVAPFLNREREFLQSLGGLVQSHAEEVKAMVLALRARAEEASVQVAPVPAAAQGDRSAGSDPSTSGRAAEDAFAPISVPGGEEVQPGHGEEAGPSAPGPGSGDRSLRELFWGQD